ncbi:MULTISPECIES: tail fiber domain-containing protein [Pantoea]|nr:MULTISPECIES: tail fiber domain-containing protein [Pantoea]
MAWYRTGTIAAAKDSKTVTGTGTKWADNKQGIGAGQMLLVPGSGSVQAYEIASVRSDTELTVTEAVASEISGSAYAILAFYGNSYPDFARQLAAQLKYYQSQMDGWQEIMTGTGDVTLVAPDGTSVTISSLSKLTSALAERAITGSNAQFSGLELMSQTPYIDFHYNKSEADYSVRMICTEQSALELTAASGNVSLHVNGGIRAGGANNPGGINLYRGNGDASSLWGVNASDGNFNIARGPSAGLNVVMGDAYLDKVKGIYTKRGASGVYGANKYQFYWTGTLMECWVDASGVGTLQLTPMSDRQLKKDIVYRHDAHKALDEVCKWQPADFKMKARGIIPETADQLGFIANDLVKVSPECVGGKGLPEDYDIEADPNNSDAYFLNQVPMIAKLTQAIQAQQIMIKELQQRLSVLENSGS